MKAKRAVTVFNTELILCENEFETLVMLAEREGTPLTFEQIYDVVWKARGIDNQTSRMGMENVISQVRETGKGFMWIEYAVQAGYIFRVRWGQNWHIEQDL